MRNKNCVASSAAKETYVIYAENIEEEIIEFIQKNEEKWNKKEKQCREKEKKIHTSL